MRRTWFLSCFAVWFATPVDAAPVSAVAYRPDGNQLAVGGNGVVRLVDPATAVCGATLPGQTRQVTALAFSNDGRTLAVASGEPAKSGELRIYARSADAWAMKHTIAAHKDLVYALAFSNDGKSFASAGYDRLIRLWSVADGKTVRTLTDHSDTIYGLAFQPGGNLLASVSADRAVKIWDVPTGVRLYTLSESTDWVYAVAWQPDGKRLAAAGIDKSIRVWEASPTGGKLVQSAFAHNAAVTKLAYSADGKTLFSVGEDRVAKAWDAGKLVETKVFDIQPDAILGFAARPDGKQIALGRFDGVSLLIDTATGKATPIQDAAPKPVSERFGVVAEKEPSDSVRSSQDVTLPVTVKGLIGRYGDADFVRFSAKAGESVGVELVPGSTPAKFDPVVELLDGDGRVIDEAKAGVLGHTFAKAGVYAIAVRDRDYRGDFDMTYTLNVGPIPVVKQVFPLSAPRGTEADVELRGVFLDRTAVKVKVPADAVIGSKIAVAVPKSLGKAELVVGEFPNRVAPGELPVPGAGHGVIGSPGAAQAWTFAAKKGRPLVVETHARRFGSPLDSLIEIADAKGDVLMRHTLRPVARVFTTFRDNDSVVPGIRLESWDGLAMGDLVLIGNELARIDQLPRNPDDDCRFVSVNGKRMGYLGTTPTHHSLGSSVFKVERHAPGSTFPDNGMPLFQLPYRNDDGQGDIGPDAGKDSHLLFDPPADGTYQVVVRDARGQGRGDFAYRVTVREPRPDYAVSFEPAAPKVWKGNGVPIKVKLTRFDGFDGPVEVRLEGVPAGFDAPPTRVEAGQREAEFTLWAPPDAVVPPGGKPLKLVAKAAVGGKEVARAFVGGMPSVVEPGDLVTTTEASEVAIVPGRESKMLVTIERRNGFAGRVPVEVRGLPYGVRVMNVGLNGILVLPGQTTREVVLYAEPWVEPGAAPFVVLAKSEGKNTEHAAKSVLLRVGK